MQFVNETPDGELLMDRRVALVTGGSRGIGREVALRLGRAGWAVAISYREREDAAADVVESLEAAGSVAISLPGDLCDPGVPQAWASAIEDRFGRLDALVNNAGITRDRLVERISDEDWDAVVSVDLTGPFRCVRACVPLLSEAPGAAIVNMGSIVGINGNTGQAAYAAAKGGLMALTKSLAREFGPVGITVNAVAAGFVMTDMTLGLTPEVIDANVRATPLRRPGLPEDVAGLVAFLCGEEARFLTGAVIRVDGGLSL